ncbi:hypothetical protein BH23GEM11_BH23GEM11_01000 [soil metagenome]
MRIRMLDKTRSHPDDVRSQVPAAGGGWSAVQVLQHLLLVEELVLSGLDGTTERGRGTPRKTLRDRVGGLAVSLVFLLRIRVRMPTRRVDPDPALPFAEVEERWSTVGLDLARRLRQANAEEPARTVLRHPVSGPLSAAQTSAFLLAHMRHHERQLQRILAAVAGPTARTGK